jgi:hypothetical protein
MGKVLKPLLTIAAVAVNFIPGIGQALSVGISAALSAAAGAIKTGRTGATLTSFDPKTINMDAAAKRKMVFGRTAFPLDLRYAEPSGTNQEYIDYVFVLAAHRSAAIEEIWIEDKQAWTSAGGAQGIYVGYLVVETILEAGAAAYHTVNAGTTWGPNQRLTGCTTMKVRVKRSNTGSGTSPFAAGIAGRWTVIGQGMPLYDPALDSTVAGGSGAQRADDCSTWQWSVSSVERGRNPALQLLAYLLGWRIDDVVSVGLGMDPALIDLPSFAVAAAKCDEAVWLSGGGSQRRYEGGIGFTDEDAPEAVMATLLAAMNAELIDDGGRLGLRVAVNDLTAAMTITDDDIQGGFTWNPAPPPAEQFTLVRGRFQQPNAPSLFGLADYPEVVIPRTSPAPKPLPLDLAAVQDVRQAERIAKQVGQRSLYVGTFGARIGIRGWFLRRNMVVAITSEARNWSSKLFRVRSLRFNLDATVDVVFREESAAVYAWDTAETGNVSPVIPTTYDPRNAPWITAVATAATTALWPNVTGTGRPDDLATRNRDGGGNLIPSPVLLDDIGITGPGTKVNVPGGASIAAQNYVVFTGAGSVLWTAFSNRDRLPVVAGEKMFYRHFAYAEGGAVGFTVGQVNWYAADLTYISTVTVAGTTHNSSTPFAWNMREGSVTVPTGAAFALPLGYADAADHGLGGPIYFGRQQPGADVTGQNTAADTSNVNGTPAATVISDIAAADAAAAAAQATADAALAVGVLAVPPKFITALGASAWVDVVIPAGESRNFQTIVYYNLTSGTTTLTAPMEYRIGTGAISGFGTANSANDSGPATLDVQNTGTLTNSGSTSLNYQVRAVLAVTGSPTGTVNGDISFVGLF